MLRGAHKDLFIELSRVLELEQCGALLDNAVLEMNCGTSVFDGETLEDGRTNRVPSARKPPTSSSQAGPE